MGPRLAGHRRRTVAHRGLLLLIVRAVFAAPCQRESGGGACPSAHCSVPDGSSLALPILPPLPATVDLYKWHNATRSWDHGYSFVNGTSHPLRHFFQSWASLAEGDFRVHSLSRRDGGLYRFQDLDGTCLALLQLTVLEAENWKWYLLLVPAVLVGAAGLGWMLKGRCRRG